MREVAALVKEEDQTAGTGGLGFWPLLLTSQQYPQESHFMDHFPLALWVGLIGQWEQSCHDSIEGISLHCTGFEPSSLPFYVALCDLDKKR